MKKVVLAVLLSVLVILASCKPSEEKPIDAWLKISPIQCSQNPWQQYWLESNKDKFPDEKSLNEAFSNAAETEMIQSFYASKGIIIDKLRFRRTIEATCAACNCPRGDTVFVSVKVADADKMRSFGFNDVTPDDKRIILMPNERYCLDDSDCAWVISNCCEGGRAFWSCYTKGTSFECRDMKCEVNKKPTRSCGCLKNICEAK